MTRRKNSPKLAIPPNRLPTIADFRNPAVYEQNDYEEDAIPDCDLTKLHTRMILFAHAFMEELAQQTKQGYLSQEWRICEGWRSPSRQIAMFAQGLSKHQPWQSAHQYGLAIDIAPFPAPADWERKAARTELQRISDIAHLYDLLTPEDEHVGHLTHLTWPQLAKTLRYPDYLDDIPAAGPQA